MSATDIDYFIRDQKSKIARHRQQLRSISPVQQQSRKAQLAQSGPNHKENIPPFQPQKFVTHPSSYQKEKKNEYTNNTKRRSRSFSPREASEEVPLAARMVEGELQHHRYLQQERLLLQQEASSNKQLDYSENSQLAKNGTMSQLRDSNSARKRKEELRNREYNEFKRLQDEKFRNRFADKKGQPAADRRSRRDDFVSPRISAQNNTNFYTGAPPPADTKNYEMPPQHYKKEKHSRLDDLERQVSELRSKQIPEQYPPPEQEYERDTGGPQYEPSFHPNIAINQRSSRAPRVENGTEDGNSLPLGDNRGKEMLKRELRNREYNDFLIEKEAKEHLNASEKRGWGTVPVYDDILSAKRAEEQKYRRYDDPELIQARPALGRRVGEPSQHTSRLDDAERQLREIESQYDKTKAKLLSKRDSRTKGSQPKMKGILDDDHFGGMLALDRLDRVPDVKTLPKTNRRRNVPEDESGLLIGNGNDEEYKHRKKQEYAQELRRQMEEQRQLKEQEARDRRSPGPNMGRSFSTSDLFSGLNSAPAILSNAGSTGASIYNTPADDAYFYYASKNPLEEFEGGNVGTFSGLGGSANEADYRRAASQPLNTNRKVRFNGSNVHEGMVFDSDAERKDKQRHSKAEYSQELQRQMEERKKEQDRRKRQQEEYDRKKDMEIANYDPYGKGGGGAPMKDVEGNVVADLHRYMHGAAPITSRGAAQQSHFSPQRYHSDTHLHHLHRSQSPNHYSHHNYTSDYKPKDGSLSPSGRLSARQTNALGEFTHARGGHGIFGQALTDEQKEQSGKYKDELRIQIEERKLQFNREKQKQKEIEEKEMKKIEDQQRKIQMEYDEELRKRKEKDDEARRANDDARKLAEEKRKEAEKKKREIHLEEEKPRSVRTPENVVTTYSPRNKSPIIRPIPTARRPSDGGTIVMSQLANMRKQLDAEKAKVESALARQRHTVEVHDPRLDQPSEVIVHGTIDPPPLNDVDVFEMVRNKQGPVPVRRAPSRSDQTQTASNELLEEFRHLKREHNRKVHNGIAGTTPVTKDTLEAQQEALLFEQLSENQKFSRMPGMNPKDLGLRPISRDSNPLEADTAFVGVNEYRYDDSDYDYSKPTLNYYPERQSPVHYDRFVNDQDSNGELEELTRKNEERLRKLKRMQSDNVSLNDPEEVLNRFMARQTSGKERPPSSRYRTDPKNPYRGGKVTTPMDESWLDPDSRI